MAPRKTREPKKEEKKGGIQGYIAGAGLVQEQRITNTLEQNYMPYAMSVIMSLFRRLTDSNRHTVNCYTQCIK